MTGKYVGIEDGIPSYESEPERPRVEFDAVLVRPLADQMDRDGWKIDPAGVAFDPGVDYIIHWNFDYSKPPLGRGRVARAEDGSLVVHGELFDISYWGKDIQPKLAIGVVADAWIGPKEGGVLGKSGLRDMALCERHADPDQPSIVIRAQIRSDQP